MVVTAYKGFLSCGFVKLVSKRPDFFNTHQTFLTKAKKEVNTVARTTAHVLHGVNRG
jgi:hypothetical protein